MSDHRNFDPEPFCVPLFVSLEEEDEEDEEDDDEDDEEEEFLDPKRMSEISWDRLARPVLVRGTTTESWSY